MNNKHPKKEENIQEPQLLEPTINDEVSIILDNIIKYFQFINGNDDPDDGDEWKKNLNKQNKLDSDLHEKTIQILNKELDYIIKKQNER